MDHTLIELDRGVLSFQVNGEIERPRWRAMVVAAVCWLKAQGGGKMLLPHALD